MSFSATHIDSKIKKQKTTLQKKSQVEKKIARKLKDVASEILNEQKELREIASEIDELFYSN